MSYSLNYEHVFHDNDAGLRIGIGNGWDKGRADFLVPIIYNTFLGTKGSNHKFELGIGITYFSVSERPASFSHNKIAKNKKGSLSGAYQTFTFGYRYMPRDGMIFKVAFTPALSRNLEVAPMFGVSIAHTL